MKRTALVAAFLVTAALSIAQQKTISFSADRMSGIAGKKTGITTLEGNGKVHIGSLEITGDRIELSGKDFRYVKASGSVTGTDTEKGFTFSADSLSYDRDREVAMFQGKATLLDSKNDVESSASIITYNQKTEIALFQVDVKLKRKDIDCKSAFALYRRTQSLLDLSGSPVVVRDGDEFRADRISVNLDTEHIFLDGSVSGTLKDAKKAEPAPADSSVPAAAGTASTGAPVIAVPETVPVPTATATPVGESPVVVPAGTVTEKDKKR